MILSIPQTTPVFRGALRFTAWTVLAFLLVIVCMDHVHAADLLVGCYPCQGFSQGGVRNPDAKINKLYLEFARALGLIRPKAFIVENVSGMVRNNFRHLLDDQFKVFTEAGYKVKADVLNAAHFGVAQERRRIFIVGIRDDIDVDYQFPTRTHGEGFAKPTVTIRDAIGDLPDWPEGEFYARDFHWYYMSRDRRNDWDETSRTIVANPRHMPLHPISPKMVKVEHNVWKFETEDRARRYLDKVGLPTRVADQYPAFLSGGQQQRVAIARALAMEPEVMLFDEPTSALDPELTGEVLRTMRELAQEHMTMLVVTHEMGFAREVAHRVAFMDGGELIEQATAAEFFAQPRHARTRAFLQSML